MALVTANEAAALYPQGTPWTTPWTRIRFKKDGKPRTGLFIAEVPRENIQAMIWMQSKLTSQANQAPPGNGLVMSHYWRTLPTELVDKMIENVVEDEIPSGQAYHFLPLPCGSYPKPWMIVQQIVPLVKLATSDNSANGNGICTRPSAPVSRYALVNKKCHGDVYERFYKGNSFHFNVTSSDFQNTQATVYSETIEVTSWIRAVPPPPNKQWGPLGPINSRTLGCIRDLSIVITIAMRETMDTLSPRTPEPHEVRSRLDKVHAIKRVKVALDTINDLLSAAQDNAKGANAKKLDNLRVFLQKPPSEHASPAWFGYKLSIHGLYLAVDKNTSELVPSLCMYSKLRMGQRTVVDDVLQEPLERLTMAATEVTLGGQFSPYLVQLLCSTAAADTSITYPLADKKRPWDYN